MVSIGMIPHIKYLGNEHYIVYTKQPPIRQSSYMTRVEIVKTLKKWAEYEAIEQIITEGLPDKQFPQSFKAGLEGLLTKMKEG